MTGDWFPTHVADYYEQPLLVGVGLFAATATTMAAPYYMTFAAVYPLLVRHRRWTIPFLVSAAWVAIELGRGRLFTGTPFFIGNPWGIIGYSQVGWLHFMQIADITGVYGMSFAVIAVNAALAELVKDLRARDGKRWGSAVGAAAMGLVPVGLLVAYGQLAIRSTRILEEPQIRVALIQGNLALGSRWRSEYHGRNLDVYLRMTHRALSQDRPDIVFWPESAMAFFLDEEPLYAKAIARLLTEADVELVAGGPSKAGESQVRYYNTIYLIAPDGEVVDRYHKQYLVPFAEYFPFESQDLVQREFEAVRTFSHGEEAALLPTRAGKAGVLTCNEAMLPEVARARVLAGAEILVNPSNDTWLADEKFAGQQFDIVSLRAVELRRYLVRPSTSGPSAIVDPRGRVQVRTRLFKRETIFGQVRPEEHLTLYARFGDSFALGCLAAVVIALVGTSRRGSSLF